VAAQERPVLEAHAHAMDRSVCNGSISPNQSRLSLLTIRGFGARSKIDEAALPLERRLMGRARFYQDGNGTFAPNCVSKSTP
jgi:hypothetical protein